jgi:hypothetical protein
MTERPAHKGFNEVKLLVSVSLAAGIGGLALRRV